MRFRSLFTLACVGVLAGCGGSKSGQSDFAKSTTFAGKTAQGHQLLLTVSNKGKAIGVVSHVKGTCPYAGKRIYHETNVHSGGPISLRDDGRFAFSQTDLKNNPPRFVINVNARVDKKAATGTMKIDWQPNIDNVGRCNTESVSFDAHPGAASEVPEAGKETESPVQQFVPTSTTSTTSQAPASAEPSNNGYTAQAKATYVKNCTGPDSTAAQCRCQIEYLAAHLPYADFKTPTAKLDPARNAAVKSCGGA
jgi:hypothetical protein